MTFDFARRHKNYWRGEGSFLSLIFTEKKICPDGNPSPRPRPSINLVTLQNRPKYFFIKLYTKIKVGLPLGIEEKQRF
jgi:hypothetical protein